MSGFKEWLDEAFSETDGKGSNKRLGGFLSLLCLEFVFVAGSFFLLAKKEFEVFKYLFSANSLLVCSFYGLSVINNAVKGKAPVTQ